MRTKNIGNISLILLLNLLIILSSFAQNTIDAEGKKQGKWIKYLDGYKFYEGQFINDIPVGEFFYFYSSGHLKIRSVFENEGRKNYVKMYFNSIKEKMQAEGYYFDKKKDSTWNYYNEDEYLIAVENYKYGLKHGEFKVFNHVGQLNLLEYYENDSITGTSTEYFETGDKFRLITYLKGKRVGVFKLFYPDGGVLMEGKYVQDVRDSIWTTYSETGDIEFLDYYAKGYMQKRTDKDGNKLDFKQEEDSIPLNIDPGLFDPTAIKR